MLTQTLFLLKDLPLAYNRDLQEDKPPLFEAYDTLAACLELAAEVVAGAELRRERIAARLEEGFLDTTALMEYSIRHDVPIARHTRRWQTASRDVRAEGCRLAATARSIAVSLHKIGPDVFGVLGVENAMNALASYGSGDAARCSSSWPVGRRSSECMRNIRLTLAYARHRLCRLAGSTQRRLRAIGRRSGHSQIQRLERLADRGWANGRGRPLRSDRSPTSGPSRPSPAKDSKQACRRTCRTMYSSSTRRKSRSTFMQPTPPNGSTIVM